MAAVPLYRAMAPGMHDGLALQRSTTSPGREISGISGLRQHLGLGIPSFGSKGLPTIPHLSRGNSFAAKAPASRHGELDGKPVTLPYPVTSPFERKRALAASITDTVYCYDFIEVGVGYTPLLCSASY